jgi:hypothetical protein
VFRERGIRDFVDKQRLALTRDLRGFCGEVIDVLKTLRIRERPKRRRIWKRRGLFPLRTALLLLLAAAALLVRVAATAALEKFIFVPVLFELFAEAPVTATASSAAAPTATAAAAMLLLLLLLLRLLAALGSAAITLAAPFITTVGAFLAGVRGGFVACIGTAILRRVLTLGRTVVVVAMLRSFAIGGLVAPGGRLGRGLLATRLPFRFTFFASRRGRWRRPFALLILISIPIPVALAFDGRGLGQRQLCRIGGGARGGFGGSRRRGATATRGAAAAGFRGFFAGRG